MTAGRPPEGARAAADEAEGRPMSASFRPVAVIPVYNHGDAVGAVAANVRAGGLHCILVDDGSSAACADVLDTLAQAPDVTLVRLARNQGKGGAMIAGLRAAAAAGWSHALQIDADGQHDARDIPAFLARAAASPDAVICGVPVYDESVPLGRLVGRYATHIWVWINSLSLAIRDSMCGFRVYPLATVVQLFADVDLGRRMDFDPEVLVRLHWRGVEIVNVPTRVTYPQDGLSHFRLGLDNWLISKMHARLFFGMLARSPMLLWRKVGRRPADAGKSAAAPGQGRHWAAIGEETFVGGMWLMYVLFRVAGRLPFRAVLYPVVLWYWLVNRRARDASLEYLRLLQKATGALGRPARRVDTIRHFFSFAETILDKMLAVGGHYRFDRIRFYGRDAIDAMVRRKQGALLVTAHMGCLEMCQASADATPGMRLTVLVHTVHAERFNKMLERLSPGRDIALMQVTEISPATAVLLAERVARGEFVAIAGDRVPIIAGRATAVQVPFLGRVAPFPTGAYMLASLLKCPLYSVACIRQGDVHEVHFERLAEHVVLPRADRLGACQAYATDFAHRIERMLARAPFEWFNFFSFWDQPGAVAAAPEKRKP